jgi:hypothetical protein
MTSGQRTPSSWEFVARLVWFLLLTAGTTYLSHAFVEWVVRVNALLESTGR